jgi:type II secretory ATPase GspE/PulE/Tfp pilus assembly ATPase PilB-like protein
MVFIYAAYRNKRVPEKHKLFGPHHRAAMVAAVPLLNKIVHITPRVRSVKPVLNLTNQTGGSIERMTEEQPGLAEAAGVLTELIMRAGATKSSRIRVHPGADQYVVQFILDGVLHNVEALETELAQQVLYCAAEIAQISRDGKLRKGTATVHADLPGSGDVPISFSVGAAGGRPSLAVDLPDWTGDIYKGGLEALGMHDAIIKRVKAAVDQGRGALLLSGPGRSGKTTSLLAAAGTVDVFTNDIMLIDKEGKRNIEQIRQTRLPADKSFAEFFADIEREGPNVILFDEIEDAEQAGPLMRFASAEGLLLTGVRAPDAPEALVYLAQLAGSSDFVDAATCVLSQRLIRKLCTSCREEVEPNPALLQKLSINPEEPGVWYRPIGCETCLNSGYLGRTALFGMLILTDPVKDALRTEGATPADIRRAAGKAAFRTMYQDGISKVTAGITTLEEVRRVLKSEQR